ncbi:MAG: 16S rRNA (uracil(1498)-N(3))-methyltransferase [Syntrophomonadaceae bacterium]|nr:16S rRNA (uracil(1498)-N(3))-methyltransferase [Syntrophomonadaceae bacterium]
MHRFFISTDMIKNNLIEIDKQQSHHIEKVLRLRIGDSVELFDGLGNVFNCRLHSNKNGVLQAEILSCSQHQNEPSVSIILAQGIAKGEKMDYVIQKAVEIGVTAIIPFVSERTIVMLDGKKAAQKTSRWQTIAREACKQSKRNFVPEVKSVVEFPQLIADLQHKRAVMLYEGEEKTKLRDILHKFKGSLASQSITIIVGPEGGFSPSEAEAAKKNSVIPISLGSGILRTETAGLVAASIILYEGGDLG